MSKFIKVSSAAGGYQLINPEHIVFLYTMSDGDVRIQLINGYTNTEESIESIERKLEEAIGVV